MHITVEREIFHKNLEKVARVSTKHISMPILQYILLEVSGGTLVLQATNLEVFIQCSLPAQEIKKGRVCVLASTLLQTISLITQKEIVIQTKGDVLVVETKTSKSSINTVSYEDFPTIPKIKGGGQEIKGVSFSQGIRTAAFAASQSSIKPELGSVYIFQKKGHALTFVATDSFRLVEKTVPQQNVVLEEGVLIPHKNALEIAHVCDVGDEKLMFFVSENQCAVEVGGIYITSRLVTGSFPDYENIIPKEFVTHTTLLVSDLQHTLKKTSIYLNKFMQLTFMVAKNHISITSKSEVGTTTEKVEATTEGDDITLSFNQRYVQEILPYISDESMTIHFAGVGRPMIIEGVHDRSLRYLVMPMNK